MPPKLLLGLFILPLMLPREVLDQVIPAGICPISFQLGGACPLGQSQCPASLPRYECLNGAATFGLCPSVFSRQFTQQPEFALIRRQIVPFMRDIAALDAIEDACGGIVPRPAVFAVPEDWGPARGLWRRSAALAWAEWKRMGNWPNNEGIELMRFWEHKAIAKCAQNKQIIHSPPPPFVLIPQIPFIQMLLFQFLLLLAFPHFDSIFAQTAVCPLGFVWGGLCGFGTFCPPSLPPFHCLRGSCCRDQRPLFARLGPIVYPQDLLGLGFGGIGGIGGGFGCFDSALNCYLYISYCFMPIYRVCMMSHCPRTCGYCGLGTLGGIGGFSGLNGIGTMGLGGFGGFGVNGLNGVGGIGGLTGLGGGLNGLGGVGIFG